MSATVFNLYQLSNAWRALLTKLSEQMGELTSDDAMAINALIHSGTSKIEDGILAKRTAELLAQEARSQARIIQSEHESVKALADRFDSLSSKIGQAMVSILELSGPVTTICGTAYTRHTPSYTFSLKEGCQIFELPQDTWRQPEPSLNKIRLKELLQAGKLPEQIAVGKSETTSVVIKRAGKSNGTIEQGAAA